MNKKQGKEIMLKVSTVTVSCLFYYSLIMVTLICSLVHINNAVCIHCPVVIYKGILTE